MIGWIFILLIGGLLAYLVFDYITTTKTDRILERLNIGFESREEENISLWEGAADLLQLEAIRNLLLTSAITRGFDIRIKRAGIKFSLLQVISIMFTATIIAAVLSYFYFKVFFAFVLPVILIPAIFWFVFSFLSARQQKRHDHQLSAMVTGLLTTMRSGGTPIQAMQATVRNSANPMKDSISGVLNNLQIGRSPNLVWKEWADFWGTKNTKLLATGIRLKWEAGGQMTTILEHILESIEFNKRIELRVGTLTAQSKLSAWVLSLLPLALGLLQYFYRPDLISSMLSDSFGTGMLIYAGVSTVLGFLWLQKIAKLKS
jgi:tight adherence protein B